MPCLEKVGLVQAHFAKYTPFYSMWTYSSLFFYLDLKSETNYLQTRFCLLRRPGKSSWCSGLCQVLLLVMSVWYLVGPWLHCWDDCSECEMSLESLVVFLATWIISCLPSWREFDLEFRTPRNNKVSLFTYKILRGGVCEVILCLWCFGSSYG